MVISEGYIPDERDFRSTLVRARDANPDGLILISYYSDGALIARQARQAGLKQTICAASSVYSPKFLELGGEAVEDVHLGTRYFPNDPRPEVQKFVAGFKAKYNGQEPDAFNAYAYDAMNMAAAVVRIGGTDRQGDPGRVPEGQGRLHGHFRSGDFDVASRRVKGAMNAELVIRKGQVHALGRQADLKSCARRGITARGFSQIGTQCVFLARLHDQWIDPRQRVCARCGRARADFRRQPADQFCAGLDLSGGRLCRLGRGGVSCGRRFSSPLLWLPSVAALVGLIIERFGLRPLQNSVRIAPLLATIGISFVLDQMVMLTFSPNPRALPSQLPDIRFQIGSGTIGPLDILIAVYRHHQRPAAVCLPALHQARLGGAGHRAGPRRRACRWASMSTAVNQAVFGIAAALGGVSGMLVGMYYNQIDPAMSLHATLKGVVAEVVGGAGNVPGAVVGSLLLGLVESYGVAVFGTSYRNLFAFLLLVVVLVLRPNGLFASAQAGAARAADRHLHRAQPAGAHPALGIAGRVRGLRAAAAAAGLIPTCCRR